MKDKNTEELIASCVKDLVQHGVIIDLAASDKVTLSVDSDDLKCNGYFLDDPLKFAVAIKKPKKKWVPVFLHEYSHFKQWLERIPLWSDADFNCLEEWLSGQEYPEADLDKSIFSLQALEHDCEIRTVALMKKHRLKIDVERYIKQANAYLLFYAVVRKDRVWYSEAPYEVKQIIDVMPGTFLKDYKVIPEDYYALVHKHCLKK